MLATALVVLLPRLLVSLPVAVVVLVDHLLAPEPMAPSSSPQ